MNTIAGFESINFSEIQIEEKNLTVQKEESHVLTIALIGIACIAITALATGGLYHYGKLSVVAGALGSVALEGVKLAAVVSITTVLSAAVLATMIVGGLFLVGKVVLNERIEKLGKLSEKATSDDGIQKECVYSSEGVQAGGDETKTPVFIQINIKDVIGKDVTGKSIQKLLKASQIGEFENGRVKGIILDINSPGGDVQESHLIYRAIKAYKKKYNIPVYAFVGGKLCASGGFYIACAADKIYASKTSLIGSVGVVGGTHFNIKDLLERFDIDSKTFAIGKGKDEMNPYRRWDSEEGQKEEHLMKFFYDTFLSVVVKNRPQLSKEKLIEEYGAGVFPAEEATEYGYIDGTKSYEKTVKNLAQAVDLDEKQPYQVIKIKIKKDVFDSLKNLSKLNLKANSTQPEVFYL